MRLPRLLAGGMLAAVLIGTAACGLTAVEPKLELRDAMSDFAAGRAGTVTLSLPSSADDVRAFAEAADPSGGDTEMSDGDLQDLLSSSVDIGYDFGEDRDSDADDASRVVVHLEDLDAGELRTVGGQMYARADIDGLAAKFPDMQEGLDEFRAQVSGGGAAGIPEAVVAPANALLDGKWVSVDLHAYLEQMEAAVGGAPGDTGPSLSDDSSAKIRDLLGRR